MQSAAEFQKRLGVRIREIRAARGFSQQSFAEACNLHRTHVSLLERGRINVTVNTTRQIAHVLEISLSELFRGLGLVRPEPLLSLVHPNTSSQRRRAYLPSGCGIEHPTF